VTVGPDDAREAAADAALRQAMTRYSLAGAMER